MEIQMDKRIKKLWVKALRSRKYKQGKNYLHTTSPQFVDRFCCLGVLCDLAANRKIVDRTVDDAGTVFYDGESQTLPRSVMKWAGIEDSIGSFVRKSDGNDIDLAALNDENMKFNKIANYIEKYF
jgi:hypothetical protein